MRSYSMKHVASLVSIALLFGCKSDVSIEYTVEPYQLDLFHNGIYSIKEGEGDVVGTMTATYSSVHYRVEGSKQIMERTLVMDKSKGYHKNSMPMELLYRVPQVAVIADNGMVNSVRGNEQFIPQVVEKLPIKEMFKRQLRDARYQLEFDRYEKRRYELTHLLQGTVPSQGISPCF
jgi:hypothetical protein